MNYAYNLSAKQIEQGTSHKLYIWHGTLAGVHNFVVRLGTFLCIRRVVTFYTFERILNQHIVF